MAQKSPYYLPSNVIIASKGSNVYILFAITAASVVPCGGRKKSPCTSSIVQIIFYLGPLRSVNIFRVLKHSSLEQTSKQCLNLTPFRNVSLI